MSKYERSMHYVLDCIRWHIDFHRIGPSVAEIAFIVSMHRDSVYDRIKDLCERGNLKKINTIYKYEVKA